jgi:hypothetical protein
MYEDLILLQDILAIHIPFIGSLSFSDWRRCKNVIDGDLLEIFVEMEESEQRRVAEVYVERRVQLDVELMAMVEEIVRGVEETVGWLCGLVERLDSITRS